MVADSGQACDDVEVVDCGGAAQVEQVLAGAAVAGTAALPMPDVGEGVLDLGAFAESGAPGRGGLAFAELGQQRFVGVDGNAAPAAAGGAALAQRAGRAGAFREVHGLAGLAFPPSRKVRDRATGSLVPVSSLGLVAEAGPPATGHCWTVQAMAVHYRVGIRHYTATVPEAGAVCGTGESKAQLQAAMTSAGG